MQEVGIDISHQKSKDVSIYANDKFEYVITVCDRAKQQCPVFPGAEPIHWASTIRPTRRSIASWKLFVVFAMRFGNDWICSCWQTVDGGNLAPALVSGRIVGMS